MTNHLTRRSRTTKGNVPFRIGLLLCGTLLILASAPEAVADSISVSYAATSISGSEWEYSYTLSGAVSAGDDLSISFPYATSSTLTDLATGGSTWTSFVLQPDSSIPADGEYDLLANVDDPSLSSVFDVTFDYSGTASPGAQSFTLYDSSFATIETGSTAAAAGVTASAVPEPSSTALLAFGLIALSVVARFSPRIRAVFSKGPGSEAYQLTSK